MYVLTNQHNMLVGFYNYNYHISFHQTRDKSLVVPRQLLWSLWEDVTEAPSLRLREAEQAGPQWNRTLGANFWYHAPADHRRGQSGLFKQLNWIEKFSISGWKKSNSNNLFVVKLGKQTFSLLFSIVQLCNENKNVTDPLLITTEQQNNKKTKVISIFTIQIKYVFDVYFYFEADWCCCVICSCSRYADVLLMSVSSCSGLGRLSTELERIRVWRHW